MITLKQFSITLLPYLFLVLQLPACLQAEEKSLDPPGKVEDNVIYGYKAPEDDYHYVAGICINREKKKDYYAGTMINPRVVMTAAQNLVGDYGRRKLLPLDILYIILGVKNLTNVMEADFRTPKDMKVHPRYWWDSSCNVGLILCKEDFPVSPKIAQIGIGDGIIQPHEKCHFFGWGLTERGPTTHLMVASVSVHRKVCPVCDKKGITYEHLDNYTLCGTCECSYKAACKGDQGAPLVCNNKVQGIVMGGTPKGSTCTGPTRFLDCTHPRILEFLESTCKSWNPHTTRSPKVTSTTEPEEYEGMTEKPPKKGHGGGGDKKKDDDEPRQDTPEKKGPSKADGDDRRQDKPEIKDRSTGDKDDDDY